MQSSRIFLIGQEENKLIPMSETSYPSEEVLQLLLASYPDLLPGDQIDPDNPRRWLLVTREMAVPGNVGESGRWSLDHLFLDQDGTPTFVECKRATDTRSRREVVAQMLDYAANGTMYWDIDRLRQAATETALNSGKQINEEVAMLIGAGTEAEIDAFWKTVDANLRAGKVRLIFVADETPRELRRLVEFLNDKMTDVEVLAVEVKQFLNGEQRVLVSRVIGLTEAARDRKNTSAPKGKTTPAQFLAKCTPPATRVFERVLSEATQRGYTIYWGEVGFSVRVPLNGTLTSIVYGFPPERLDVYFGYLTLPEEQVQAFRKQLTDLGLFKPSGTQTLKAWITEANESAIQHAYTLILSFLDSVVALQAPPQ